MILGILLSAKVSIWAECYECLCFSFCLRLLHSNSLKKNFCFLSKSSLIAAGKLETWKKTLLLFSFPFLSFFVNRKFLVPWILDVPISLSSPSISFHQMPRKVKPDLGICPLIQKHNRWDGYTAAIQKAALIAFLPNFHLGFV